MPAFICNTCGTQYEPSENPPAACPICDDERQYVPRQARPGPRSMSCRSAPPTAGANSSPT